jgi:uncharacterized protein YdcH (DUF465 family)
MEVFRVENNIEPKSGAAWEELKERRLAVKDKSFQVPG